MNHSTSIKEIQKIELEQGCQEWHALRKTKITATDASVIMGASHWKTRIQLYNEKLSNDAPMAPNSRMQRGTDLEPIARDLFNIKTGFNMKPAVLIKDWAMASLDGLDENIFGVLEVKCPGAIDHERAVNGSVPDHYYPQLQHQMYVAGVPMVHYFSFDGMDGVIVKVKRDDNYIEKMIEEEKKFYECLMNKTPPEPLESDYVERNDFAMGTMRFKMEISDELHKRIRERAGRAKKTTHIVKWRFEYKRSRIIALSSAKSRKCGLFKDSSIERD